MTIKVSVKNEDTRDGAVVVVKSVSVATGESESAVPAKELNAGESTEAYVHSGQRIVVEEVRQP